MMRTAAVSLGLLGLCLSSSVHAQTLQEQELQDAFANLNWQYGANNHTISSSNAVIRTYDDEAFLEGKDAWEFMRLSEGHDAFKPDALVLKLEGPMADSLVIFSYSDIGYVKMHDWDEFIDPDEVLSEMNENTKRDNKARAEGYPKLYIDGWSELPHLDRENAVVYWAIRGHDDQGQHFINAKALKLGRKGFSDLVWIGSPEQFTGASQNLQPALESYVYQKGFRYADFQPSSDTVAAVGVGAIAYKMLTGSSKKGAAAVGAGIVAVVLAFAKKLWFLIFLPFVFAWKWVKGLFSGGPVS